ncbi:unnamed protein product [Arctogadus glacialis]
MEQRRALHKPPHQRRRQTPQLSCPHNVTTVSYSRAARRPRRKPKNPSQREPEKGKTPALHTHQKSCSEQMEGETPPGDIHQKTGRNRESLRPASQYNRKNNNMDKQ